MKFIILIIVLNILGVRAVVHSREKPIGELEKKLYRINSWVNKIKNETVQIGSEIAKLMDLVTLDSNLIKERLNEDILKMSDEFLLSFRKLKTMGVPIKRSEIIAALAAVADIEAKIRHDVDKCIDMNISKISQIDNYNTQLIARADDEERKAKALSKQVHKILDSDTYMLRHFQLIIDQVEAAVFHIMKVSLEPYKKEVESMISDPEIIRACYTDKTLDLIRQEINRHLENFKFSYETVNIS